MPETPVSTRDRGRMVTWAQGRASSVTEFVAVDNQIHFHPDERLAGFAILVLLRRSALRPAGVHLLDTESHRWRKAADLDQLPLHRWVHLRSAGGAPVPVEVLRTNDRMCVRWLGSDDGPVEPAPWDRTRRVSPATSPGRARRPSTRR
jgi:hypothetical protein